MKNVSRRKFMEMSGLGIAGLSFHPFRDLPKKPRGPLSFKLGLASYTFRNYTLDQALAMADRLNIRRMSLKSMHLPLDSTKEQIEEALRKIKAAGVDVYAGGVIYMNSKEDVDNAFRYAGDAGMQIIVGVPAHDLLKYAEGFVKKTGIKLAIHNHGPTDKVYPTPESVYNLIRDLDPGVGLCLDIGHTARAGLDPAEQAKKYMSRILDMHIKDETAPTAQGDTIEMGRGIIDLPAFFRTLVNEGYKHTASFEFEKDPDDVLPGLSESVGYAKGILAVI